MHFTITGKIKPYVRMTQRGKWVKPNAIEYRDNQQAIGWQFKEQMTRQGWEMLPPKKPLCVVIRLWLSGLHKADIDNQAKAILDAAQGVVFHNDQWIDSLVIVRKKDDKHVAQITIEEIAQ